MTDLDPFDALGSELGGRALRQMVQRWGIRGEWAWDQGPTRFSWLGSRRPQSFAVEVGIEGGAPRLVATTRVVEGVPDAAAARGELEGYNRLAKGSTWWVDDEGGISLHCATPIDDEGLDGATHDLSAIALIQLFTAEVMADPVAEAVGGRPVVGVHPRSGTRSEADDVLAMVEQALVPIGLGGSQFARPEVMEAAGVVMREQGWGRLHDGGGLVVVGTAPSAPAGAAGAGGGAGAGVPDGASGDPEGASGDPDGVFGGASGDPRPRVGAAIRVEVDPITRDPDLGAGLTTRVVVPLEAVGSLGGQGAARLARRLNRAEREGRFEGPLYGAWDVADDDDRAIVHTWFTYNALFGPARVRERTEVSVRRAAWVARYFGEAG